MESDDGFEAFSRAIATDPIGELLAKWRRDVFIRKLEQLPDVIEVIPSGSLARGTQIGPVHDVDLIVVVDKDRHPDYGIKGGTNEAKASAQASISDLETKLREQLHPWLGTAAGLNETEQRTHVVKFNGDWAGPFKEWIPVAPPVDVMPAVREGSHLLIPERGTGWIDVDPERLIRLVAQRQREWKYFTEVVGMVKAWARLNNLKMKSLAVEVMVLQYCPRPGFFETMSVGDAVARFFEAAAKAHITSLKDPAGRCGEIDPRMDFRKLRSALKDAADLSKQAMDAEHDWKNPYAVGKVTHPDVYWRQLFGKKYPRTKKLFWRAPETELWRAPETGLWFRPYTVEYTGPAEAGNPKRPDNPAPKKPDEPDEPDEPDLRGGGGMRGPDGGPQPPSGGLGRPRPRSHEPRPPSTRPGPRHRQEHVPAEPAASYWTRVSGPAAAAAAVPLTYG